MLNEFFLNKKKCISKHNEQAEHEIEKTITYTKALRKIKH